MRRMWALPAVDIPAVARFERFLEAVSPLTFYDRSAKVKPNPARKKFKLPLGFWQNQIFRFHEGY